jgi:hypothetical protein
VAAIAFEFVNAAVVVLVRVYVFQLEVLLYSVISFVSNT